MQELMLFWSKYFFLSETFPNFIGVTFLSYCDNQKCRHTFPNTPVGLHGPPMRRIKGVFLAPVT